MLSVRHLRVGYGRSEIVRDVSFEVPERAVVALMGGNGAGKSTILRALSGLVKPRGGEVHFLGAQIAGCHPREMVMRGLVQVPQGRFVWPAMSVRENLELGGVTRSAAEREASLAQVCALFPALQAQLRTRAGQLSGGQQQMVAVGRALMARPRMLMMDEPSAGLAPRIVDEMVEAIRRLQGTGLSILLVEQNLGVAAALADTVLMLVEGTIASTMAGAALAHASTEARRGLLF